MNVCGYVTADKIVAGAARKHCLEVETDWLNAGAEFRSICYAGKPSVSVQWLLSVARCSPDPRDFDDRSRSPLWVSFITKFPPNSPEWYNYWRVAGWWKLRWSTVGFGFFECVTRRRASFEKMKSDNNKLITAQRWSLELSFNDKAINHLTGEQKECTYE